MVKNFTQRVTKQMTVENYFVIIIITKECTLTWHMMI